MVHLLSDDCLALDGAHIEYCLFLKAGFRLIDLDYSGGQMDDLQRSK